MNKNLLSLLIAVCTVVAVINAQAATGPALFPQPQSITSGTTTIQLNAATFKIATSSTSQVLAVAIARYQKLFFTFGVGAKTTKPASTLNLVIASSSEDLQMGVDESYTLAVSATGSLTITSNTIYGAMRGLETFSQLISYNQAANTYSIPFAPIQITDFPRFEWRGLMIDTGRHFMPVTTVLHTVEACAYNKLNVLHWHIVDGQSFPATIASYPNMTDGEEVVAYGKTFGVRVVPEIDIPGHSTSWGIAFPSIMSSCPDHYILTDNPLSPANDLTYTVVNTVLSDLAEIFIDDTLHTCANELYYDCWQEDPIISEWMNQNGINATGAEQYFEDKLDGILENIQKTKVVWNDPFSNGIHLKNGTIVQVWDSTTLMQQIVNAGLRAIASFDYYLDKQVPVSGSTHYEFVDTWQDFYNSDPLAGLTANQDMVIGGEACMWGEQVDQRNFDVRVWPRTLGVSERLWSNETVTSVDDAIPRPMERLTRAQVKSILGKQ
eukprot:gene1361-1560_t